MSEIPGTTSELYAITQAANKERRDIEEHYNEYLEKAKPHEENLWPLTQRALTLAVDGVTQVLSLSEANKMRDGVIFLSIEEIKKSAHVIGVDITPEWEVCMRYITEMARESGGENGIGMSLGNLYEIQEGPNTRIAGYVLSGENVDMFVGMSVVMSQNGEGLDKEASGISVQLPAIVPSYLSVEDSDKDYDYIVKLPEVSAASISCVFTEAAKAKIATSN